MHKRLCEIIDEESDDYKDEIDRVIPKHDKEFFKNFQRTSKSTREKSKKDVNHN